MNTARWKTLSLAMQLVNIDSELARAQALLRKQDPAHADNCFRRALELIDASLAVQTSLPTLRELARLRDVVALNMIDQDDMALAVVRHLLQPFTYRVALERQ